MDVSTAILTTRPAVHQICVGAFIQERLHLGGALWAIPLQPLGFAAEAATTARYASELLGAVVDHAAFDNLVGQGKQARALVSLVRHFAIDATPADLESNAQSDLALARRVIAWSSGERAEPIAMVTTTSAEIFFRMIPPATRNRQRLGMGNERDHHEPVLQRIFQAMATDERFSFAVSLYVDALSAEDPEFRVARFYACLEALTYRIRSRHGGRSRAAVRDLLGLLDGAAMTVNAEGEQLTVDRVELGGRVRDKLFHGVPFDESELNDDGRRAYAYLKQHPSQMRDILMTDCELEIARWANGASRGLSSDAPGV